MKEVLVRRTRAQGSRENSQSAHHQDNNNDEVKKRHGANTDAQAHYDAEDDCTQRTAS